MLNPRFFEEEHLPELEKSMKKRNASSSVLDKVRDASKARRKLILETDKLKAQRNAVSMEIGQLKAKAKSDPAAAKLADEKVAAMKGVGDEIKVLEEQLKTVEGEFDAIAYSLPNLLDATVPEGKGAEENQEVRTWGTPTKLAFEPKDHVTLGELHGILNFERAARISGSRFVLTSGPAARLERALIAFMLDLHTLEHGYTEVNPPFLVNRTAMTGTGQLPKFETDLFKTQTEDRELFLIPTSEVPVTNIHREEILEKAQLPICYTAYSPCFRSEAGSYGKDTRGMIRVHQFEKVEMVKFAEPEHSMAELDKMVANAERILQLLEIPYRVMLLCGGDTGFGSCKTYDLEAWIASQNAYREISSCSNFGDFQARRAQIRYRLEPKGKPQLVHTLNGSGLAVGRTVVALLENGQQADGSIRLPKALNKYLEGAPGFTLEDGQYALKMRRDG